MEYRVGGGTDLNENGGWLKIKSVKYQNQTFINIYLGDDGFWRNEPVISFDSHWIDEIIYGLQFIQNYLKDVEK